MKKLILASIIAFGVVSCGNETQTVEETTDTDTTATVEEETAAESEVSNTIVIEGMDNMQFDKTEFTVKAGEEITLTLKNVGELPAENMSHNVVVLTAGTDVKEFALAGIAFKDAEYISPDTKDDVLALTAMLGPGEEDTITFTLEAGVYPFVCTFPGHYGSMQGTITAQ